MISRYPILRRLIVTQVLTMLAGIGILYSVYHYSAKAQLTSEISQVKEQVTPILAARQEKWRAWKYLGLDAAIDEELAAVAQQFRLEQLSILPRSAVSKGSSETSIIFPEKVDSEDDFVLFANINTSHIDEMSNAHRTILIVLSFVSILFLVSILASGRYIYRSIYRPILRMNEVLANPTDGKTAEMLAIPAIGEMKRFVTVLYEVLCKVQLFEKQSAVLEVASQVSHDIRSPLAALDVVVQEADELSEDKRLLVRRAVSRIHDISNNLLALNRNTTRGDELQIEPMDTYLLSSILDALVSEKRFQFKSLQNIEIDLNLQPECYGIFVSVQLSEFKRAISNLVNNAVESINEQGKVEITVMKYGAEAIVKVTDNGCGIDPSILQMLGKRGNHYGKPEGSGLGLYHARAAVHRWGGQLEIASEVGLGTNVSIKLLSAEAPKWFVERLEIAPKSTIVVLDDDTSIHQIWSRRFNENTFKNANWSVIHLSTPSEFETWISNRVADAPPFLLLTDFELLPVKTTGLDLVEKFGLQAISILVTGRYEESSILARCKANHMKVIPKGMAGFVPIVVSVAENPDAILIDDDPLIHQIWEIGSERAAKRTLTFHSESELEKRRIEPSTPVYVDRRLANGASGIDVLRRLHAKGFRRLYLATGDEITSEEVGLPFLAGIVGKDFPLQK